MGVSFGEIKLETSRRRGCLIVTGYVDVKLDGKLVGTIHSTGHPSHGTTRWQYIPKGQRVGGEPFTSLHACKRSLESE